MPRPVSVDQIANQNSKLLQSRSILKFSEHIGNVVRFMHEDRGMEGAGAHVNRVYIMDEQDWIDFGEPEEITVTVDPGDKLNAVDSDSPFSTPKMDTIRKVN